MNLSRFLLSLEGEEPFAAIDTITEGPERGCVAMSKRKQRIVLEGFTFSVGKLIIEHETEKLDGDALSADVRNAIGQVISAPSRLLSTETIEVPAATALPSANASAKPRKRRRRSSDNAADSDSNGTAYRLPRAKPNSARGLIEEMKASGFFAQDRAISEVRDELHTLGHTFKSNELSPVLLAMTKQKALSRKKDDSGNWVYRAG